MIARLLENAVGKPLEPIDPQRAVAAGPHGPGVLSARIAPYVERGAIAGVVAAVGDRDGARDVAALGWRDIATRAPMREDAVFWIASMSKPMTATALMMLVDEGRVALHDPVEKHLPEYAGLQLVVAQDQRLTVLEPAPRPITVAEVLSHTSGLAFWSRLDAGKIDRFTLREQCLAYALTPLRCAPGARYEYANSGTNTAGRIVEVVSGMPFERFLEERLIGPLGMRDTTFWPDRGQLQRLATSYRPNAAKDALEPIAIEQLTYPLDDRRRGPSPAGGYFATAADVMRFGRMILRGGELDGQRYLSEEAVARMTARHTPAAWPQAYGLAWGVDADGNCGHGGAYATNLWLDRKRGFVQVWMVQHAGYLGVEGAEVSRVFAAAAADAVAR